MIEIYMRCMACPNSECQACNTVQALSNCNSCWLVEQEFTPKSFSFVGAMHCFVLLICNSWIKGTPVAAVFIFAIVIGAIGIRIIIPV